MFPLFQSDPHGGVALELYKCGLIAVSLLICRKRELSISQLFAREERELTGQAFFLKLNNHSG